VIIMEKNEMQKGNRLDDVLVATMDGMVIGTAINGLLSIDFLSNPFSLQNFYIMGIFLVGMIIGLAYFRSKPRKMRIISAVFIGISIVSFINAIFPFYAEMNFILREYLPYRQQYDQGIFRVTLHPLRIYDLFKSLLIGNLFILADRILKFFTTS